jgi:hypothetical protein
MGRYYHGQITGKFWFGIQSSDDATYFGVHFQPVYCFYSCGCYYEREACEKIEENEDLQGYDPEEHIYCLQCFDSFEEHNQQIKEEQIEREDEKTWFLSEQIFYQFLPVHLPIIEHNLELLETEVGKYIQSYSIIDTDKDGNSISYSYKLIDSVQSMKKDTLQLILDKIARLCLGRQILYCVKTYDSCSFYAEC